jgi:hypothetical protein
MRKIFCLMALPIFVASCNTKLQYMESRLDTLSETLSQNTKDLDLRLSDVENMFLDTDKDGVPDYLDVENNSIAGVSVDTKGRMVDLNRNNVPDNIEKYIDDATRVYPSAPATSAEYIIIRPEEKYFRNLIPTESKYVSHFLKRGSTLGECHNRIRKVLEDKLHFEEGDFKYMSLSDDGFAIITKKQCITKAGVPISDCDVPETCRWYDITCAETEYSQFYLLMVSKKNWGETIGFSEADFRKHYTDDDLDVNWNSVPEIKALFENKDKKFTTDYTFVVKLIEIQKTQMDELPFVVARATYKFKQKITGLFPKPATP